MTSQPQAIKRVDLRNLFINLSRAVLSMYYDFRLQVKY